MDDPAITKAKSLWKDKQPREAMKVLIVRIRELNEVEARQTAATTPPVVQVQWLSPRAKRNIRTVALFFVIVVVCLVTAYVAMRVYWYYNEDEIIGGAHLHGFCTDAGISDCDGWEKMVRSQYADDFESCSQLHSDFLEYSAFRGCLISNGVPHPTDWQAAQDAATGEPQLSAYCAMARSWPEKCAQWEIMVKEQFSDEMIFCASEFDTLARSDDFGFCLVSIGVPEPATWEP